VEIYKANENCCNMWRCTKPMKTVVTCGDVQSQWKLTSPHVTTVFIDFVHLHMLQQFSLALYISTCYNSFHWLCISPHVTTVFIGFVHLHILQQFSLALYIYTCYNSFHWLCTSPHVTTVFISIVHLHMLQQFSLALYISTCYNNFHWLSSLDIFQCIKHHFLSNKW
jgi:hypothetical protein